MLEMFLTPFALLLGCLRNAVKGRWAAGVREANNDLMSLMRKIYFGEILTCGVLDIDFSSPSQTSNLPRRRISKVDINSELNKRLADLEYL